MQVEEYAISNTILFTSNVIVITGRHVKSSVRMSYLRMDVSSQRSIIEDGIMIICMRLMSVLLLLKEIVKWIMILVFSNFL